MQSSRAAKYSAARLGETWVGWRTGIPDRGAGTGSQGWHELKHGIGVVGGKDGT